VTRLRTANAPSSSHCQSCDRAVAATLAGRFAIAGAPAEAVELRFTGTQGRGWALRSPTAFHVCLDGYANDGVGEAMSGGVLVVTRARRKECIRNRQRRMLRRDRRQAFCAGRAGQRLGVRNSGAIVVAEGAGKYAFEYMTGGVGVVLGPSVL